MVYANSLCGPIRPAVMVSSCLALLAEHTPASARDLHPGRRLRNGGKRLENATWQREDLWVTLRDLPARQCGHGARVPAVFRPRARLRPGSEGTDTQHFPRLGGRRRPEAQRIRSVVVNPSPRPGSAYLVYVSDCGNIFMTEIAALLAAALGDLGYDVVFPAPGLPEARPGRINLVVAPHEFFPFQRGYSEAELLRAAAASVTVGVEQPGTHWFELGLHYASVSRSILDISPLAVRTVRERGYQAELLELGYHRSWDQWGGDPTRRRSTDLLFLGSVSPRRERILGEIAPMVWDCAADLRLFEFPRPMTEPRANFAPSKEKWDLLASSRVMLNVHRSETPYFERIRNLEAVVNGCLVVTEESTEYGRLEPGRHLIAVAPEFLGASAASMVLDEPLRADMALEAYDFARSSLALTSLLEPVCEHMETLPAPTSTMRRPWPFTPPAAPDSPTPNDARMGDLRVSLKRLFESETQLLQQVEALQAGFTFGDPGYAEILTTPAWRRFEPVVSVVVTSYNYERFLIAALESAMSSVGVPVEMVVVDDHSTDGSVDAVRRLMVEAPDFPMMLLAGAANRGVAAARNVGIEQARADRLFILDADNLIYPRSLATLSAALTRSPEAGFAFGMIAKMGKPELVSHLPFNVERLCQSNYIDAMALIRRSIFTEFGGYDPHFGRMGWEDYELWLRLAANGVEGAFVSEFIGQYRVHDSSREEIAWLDTVPITEALRGKFPYLPWPPR